MDTSGGNINGHDRVSSDDFSQRNKQAYIGQQRISVEDHWRGNGFNHNGGSQGGLILSTLFSIGKW